MLRPITPATTAPECAPIRSESSIPRRAAKSAVASRIASASSAIATA
ncbi:MAG: hypothetical protein KC468_33610 [Myxococcales bacterium]|nr:hypothetical protein [Myxococcales bacterium]